MKPTLKPLPKLNDGQVADEIVNDSLGTVDLADTSDTDPKDDPSGDKGTGPRENA
jgi:hypothetical protein